MNQIEQRLVALEASHARFRWLSLFLMLLLPMAGLLAGAGLQEGFGKEPEAVPSRIVTRSLVVVDDQNRPRVDLGYDEAIGPHVFLRDERGLPMLALSAPRASGVVTILNGDGHAIAMISGSGTGDGLLKLADAKGGTMLSLGRWAGMAEPGLEFNRTDPAAQE